MNNLDLNVGDKVKDTDGDIGIITKKLTKYDKHIYCVMYCDDDENAENIYATWTRSALTKIGD